MVTRISIPHLKPFRQLLRSISDVITTNEFNKKMDVNCNIQVSIHVIVNQY